MLTIGKPLTGMDLTQLSKVRTAPFLARVLFYLAMSGGCITVILSMRGIPVVIATVVLGLIYAHGVELQHQALHNTGLPSKILNRIVGFFLGLPMLVSYSDYQYHHLQHHRLLGTKENREFFNYGYDRLTSLKPLIRHLLMVSHYRDVSVFMARSLLGKLRPGVKEEAAVKIRTEYCLMALFLVTMVVITIAFKTALFLKIWLLPLLIAIPTHALIELPEHWSKPNDTLDVRMNTRTIKASWFGTWFTNGNNYHIEHHWLPSVPNDRFGSLHKLIEQEIEVDTYPAFYKKFFLELYRNTFIGKGQAEVNV